MKTANNNPFLGRMNDPTGSAFIRGQCGDEMEMYIYVRDGTIEDVKYYTDGCADTHACGAAVARRAIGRSINDSLSISPGDLILAGECEPESGRHCAILAVSTFYRAVVDYLLKP